ncbi:hypothetical protein OD91_1488 [Lutibacter sp. Hel_I_33_5]|uniref:hypothetical protein n=1 Tax=Lutibacter sp. Hel_I_33_5 TaxID=1566289 RepID=UPI00119F0099|nr:hypothetical protein [Lutibacter sp. Hel_I_33_5]TVZ56208.1 hypothetical protein OD91_1488 [Lutibacter sp. Hel_I_33_5]
MKKKLSILAASVFMMTLFSQCELFKHRINHKGKIIEVSKNALEAHLAHGDVVIANIYKKDDGTLCEGLDCLNGTPPQ